MPFSRYLAQKELEAAVEEIVMEPNDDQSDGMDAVYIPPEVDTLTDEEDVNDDMNPRESEEPIDIVGTFELHVPDNTELPDQSFTLSTENPEWDSSGDESLESKRRLTLSTNDRLASTVKWKKGQIEYAHTPISDEFRSCEELKIHSRKKLLLKYVLCLWMTE
nr:unnamed protein product [Callosobruchus chinensis]